MSPSMAGATTTGAVARQAGGRDDVVGQTAGHRRQPARGGRRDQDQVGGVGGDDVRDALVGQQLERVGHRPAAGERLERERPDECCAEWVMSACTSAPAVARARASSADLYAAMEPVTPSRIRRPSSVFMRRGRVPLARPAGASGARPSSVR